MSTPAANAYEIKSAELSLVALWLRTTDLQVLAQALQSQLAETPGFFDQDPVLVDLSDLPQDGAVPDFDALRSLLASHQMRLVAFRGASPAWRQAALQAGLVDGNDARVRPSSSVPSQTSSPEPSAMASIAETGALVIDKPLRSGQQVYARGRDLVLLAMVNPGAEVIADGSIHVYAALRGKAIAGAKGLGSARIFAQVMEPELVSIAGVYRTSENPLPPEIHGKPATVQLRSDPGGDRLLIEPLNH